MEKTPHKPSVKMRHRIRSIQLLVLAVLAGTLAQGQARPNDGVMVLRLEENGRASASNHRDAGKLQPQKLDAAFEKPTPTALSSGPAGGPPAPSISALSAVLVDATTGQVLFAKNPHLRRPNASTTKIMTAILLIENCGMSQLITASKNAAETPFTSIRLQPGETITAKDLLMAMMVRSANDAAVAAAEHISGSVSKFAELMNAKAKEIGCNNTHFVTPNGLPAKGHYSTAYDLCLMARYAIRYPVFNEAAASRSWVLSSRTMNRKDLYLTTKSKFLVNYPGADGIKSGYVKEAGYCYVGSATRNGWRLVSAVLKSDNPSQETASLMDYVFDNFQPITVARKGEPFTQASISGGSIPAVPSAPAQDFHVVVPKSNPNYSTRCEFVELRAPVARGATVGTLIATVNGREVARVALRATESVGISFARQLWGWTKILALAAIGLFATIRYGNTLAKVSRRRRDRVAAAVRGVDRFG